MKLKLKLKWKRVGKLLLLAAFLIVIIIFVADRNITRNSKAYLFNDASLIPENKTGLLLGCSKHLSDGRPNLFFVYRINAAVELYNAGKVHAFVISGDNSRSDYNEPQDMKDELIKNGVPDNIIYLDYAGFRTLDSVVRLNKIFGQKSFTVISQQFHNERAVYIAQHYGLKACGYNSKDVTQYAGLKTKVREKFARVKVFIDGMTGKQPKFLGEPIEIK